MCDANDQCETPCELHCPPERVEELRAIVAARCAQLERDEQSRQDREHRKHFLYALAVMDAGRRYLMGTPQGWLAAFVRPDGPARKEAEGWLTQWMSIRVPGFREFGFKLHSTLSSLPDPERYSADTSFWEPSEQRAGHCANPWWAWDCRASRVMCSSFAEALQVAEIHAKPDTQPVETPLSEFAHLREALDQSTVRFVGDDEPFISGHGLRQPRLSTLKTGEGFIIKVSDAEVPEFWLEINLTLGRLGRWAIDAGLITLAES